jgi:hypothetical protein
MPVAEPQLAPPPGFPSSVDPSQLLSRPSQISVTGPRPPTQVKLPLTHCIEPARHSPTLEPQLPIGGTPSSITPLQSLSTPSHVSGLGLVPPTHTKAPPVHVNVPGEHAPMLVPQLAPPPGLPSSVEPSQLLSIPSHTSVAPGWAVEWVSSQSVLSAT